MVRGVFEEWVMKKMLLVLSGLVAMNAMGVIDVNPGAIGELRKVPEASMKKREGETTLQRIYRMSSAEEMLISEEDVHAALKDELARRYKDIDAKMIDDIGAEQAAIPASIRAVPKALERRRETIVREQLDEANAEKVEQHTTLRKDTHDALKESASLRRNIGVGTLRTVTAGGAVVGALLAKKSFDALSADHKKLLDFVNKDEAVIAARKAISDQRALWMSPGANGLTKLQELKQLANEADLLAEKVKNNPRAYIAESLRAELAKAEEALVSARNFAERFQGKGNFGEGVQEALKHHNEVVARVVRAERAAQMAAINEAKHARRFQYEVGLLANRVAEARKAAVFKYAKVTKAHIKGAGVVGGVLLVVTGAGLTYKWMAGDESPVLDERTSLSFLKSGEQLSKSERFEIPKLMGVASH